MASSDTKSAQRFRGFASKALECGELDDYLSALLLPQFLQTFKYAPFSLPKSDIKNILSFATFSLSVKSVESTPACKALGLKLTNTRRSSATSLLVYAVLKLLMPRLRRLVEEKYNEYRIVSTATADDKSPPTEALAQDRQCKVLKTLLEVFDKTIPMLRFLLVIKCWTRIRKYSSVIPDLEKWLSGFRYEAVASPTMPLIPKGESIHILFAHRRWVQRWLLTCVPIMAIPLMRSAVDSREMLLSWKEELQRCFVLPIWNFLLKTADPRLNIKSQCPICHTENITIPVETNCGHLYCYTCLWTYLRKQDRRHCKACSKTIAACHPIRIG